MEGEPQFPEVHPSFQYLVDLLFEIGPTSYAGMGETPLTEQDIYYWQQNHRERLDSWEIRLLRRMSAEYMAARDAAEYKGASRPYTELERIEVIERVSAKQASGLKAMFAKAAQQPQGKK